MPPIFKKADFALALLLIILSAVFLLASSTKPAGERATIRVDGGLFAWVNLSQPSRIEIKDKNGLTLAFAVCEGGKIHVEQAVCRDKICQRTAIFRAGEMIICLPGRIVIEIEDADYDAQVY